MKRRVSVILLQLYFVCPLTLAGQLWTPDVGDGNFKNPKSAKNSGFAEFDWFGID